MCGSNIRADSNIYSFLGERPEYDQDYVKRVKDIKLLKRIKERGYYSLKVAQLETKQLKAIEFISICEKAKEDPCWGYSFDEHGEMISKCKCINGDCEQIKTCNPNYSEEYAAEWRIDNRELMKYGNPLNVEIRYFVDIESQHSIKQYKSEPVYDGLVYESKDLNEDSGRKRKKRKNPDTGKNQTHVGNKWEMVGGDYGSEVYEEIWVDDNIEISKDNNQIVKAPVIELCDNSSIENRYTIDTQKSDSKSEIVNKVKAELSNNEAIRLLEGVDHAVLVCDNLAERGFFSKTLTDYGIFHGYNADDKIQIICKDQDVAIKKETLVIITASTLNGINSDLHIWSSLLTTDKVYSLKPTNREYKQVKVQGNTFNICVNNYGVTHICIDVKDLDNLLIKDDGIYELKLELLCDEYTVIYNGNIVGYVSNEFKEAIRQFYDRGDIARMPVNIEGVQLIQNCGEKYILGIGHMKFSDY